MAKKVLLIDDDPDLGRLMDSILRPLDITVYQSFSGTDGLRMSYAIHPDLIILDVMMPEMNGFDVCARLREMSNVPILMLTARSNDNDMIRGFKLGVDDFVKKPFNKNELVARVNALLRRYKNPNTGPAPFVQLYKDPALEIDMDSQTVKLHNRIVELTKREYNLLAYLVRQQGRLVSKHELVREVWGEAETDTSFNPSLYVFYLRKKLKDGSDGHQYLHTLWGRGYWFEPRRES